MYIYKKLYNRVCEALSLLEEYEREMFGNDDEDITHSPFYRVEQLMVLNDDIKYIIVLLI